MPNPTKSRLLDLAAGWAGSDAAVTLTPADARALGVKADPGRVPTLPGREIGPRAAALPDDEPADPPADDAPADEAKAPAPKPKK